MVGPAGDDDEGRHGEDRKVRVREEKNGERERERENVDWWHHRTDSCAIVEMGEWHGYGERMGKKIGRRKEKTEREWRVAVVEKWVRKL